MAATITKSPETKSPEKWLKVHPDVTGITRLSRTTLYAEMSAGRLKSVKCGGSRRIKESDLVAWQAGFDGSGELDAV